MDRDRLPRLVMKYQPYGRRSQRRRSVGFWNVKETEQVTSPKSLQPT